MRKLFINWLFIVVTLIFNVGCKNKSNTCCVIGPRNLNGNIASTGQGKDVSDMDQCKKDCDEVGLAADWFDKPCDQVQKGTTEYEKGTKACD